MIWIWEIGRRARERRNHPGTEIIGKLEKRVEAFKILPLSPEARAEYKTQWQIIQARFVDDPKDTLAEADRLIRKIMAARGYPVSDFEQRAADVSVNYPEVVEEYRAGHAISLQHAQGKTLGFQTPASELQASVPSTV